MFSVFLKILKCGTYAYCLLIFDSICLVTNLSKDNDFQIIFHLYQELFSYFWSKKVLTHSSLIYTYCIKYSLSSEFLNIYIILFIYKNSWFDDFKRVSVLFLITTILSRKVWHSWCFYQVRYTINYSVYLLNNNNCTKPKEFLTIFRVI